MRLVVSDNQAKAVGEAGKAVAEAAKLGGKLVDAVSGVGGYLARTLGTIPEDVLGVAGGDWLHEHRRRNLAKLQAKTAAILERIGVEAVKEPSASVIVPLLQAAADEGREELQDLWAALLARAMSGERRVRRQFFEVLRRMEPADAIVLRLWAAPPDPNRKHPDRKARTIRDSAAEFGIKDAEYSLAIASLIELGCLASHNKFNVGGTYTDITPLGRELIVLCDPDGGGAGVVAEETPQPAPEGAQ